MKNNTGNNSKRYMLWLVVMSLLGSLAGWTVQGLISEKTILWALPLIMILCICFTINGDNVIESIVPLTILGGILFALSRSETVINFLGHGTILGIYVALFISKLGFAFVKQGVLGNKPSS
jgi:uncharacterized membrane protein YfcA